MENIAIRKADELSPAARRAVEKVLGRALKHDEEISIMAFSPRPAPTGEARQAAAHQLKSRMNKTARRVRGVSSKEQESVINEAVNYARSRTK